MEMIDEIKCIRFWVDARDFPSGPNELDNASIAEIIEYLKKDVVLDFDVNSISKEEAHEYELGEY